jgi:hypothetical protein
VAVHSRLARVVPPLPPLTPLSCRCRLHRAALQPCLLLQVMPKPDMPREAVLVDRRHDKALGEMHAEAAEAVARAGSSGEACLARYQALANVVAGHLGGALVRRRRLLLLGCCCPHAGTLLRVLLVLLVLRVAVSECVKPCCMLSQPSSSTARSTLGNAFC